MSRFDYTDIAEAGSFRDAELRRMIAYLEDHSPFYREHFRINNIDTRQIRSTRDLEKIPPVTKDDLQRHNDRFFCVPEKSIIEYCTTSGTMGNPVTVPLTENDLKRLAQNEFESFACAGMSQQDVVLLMLSLDRMFMAGIAYYLGARQMGAGIIRGGPGNFAMQLETIARLRPTVLVAVPSFIVGMTAFAEEKGVDLNQTSVKKIICIGENIRNGDLTWNALGNRIRKSWDVELYSTYASTEQQTAFTECALGRGGHHHPELLIFEVLDDDNRSVPPGVYGELVITTLGVEGMPLLRYKTGDICTYYNEPCGCGRTTARISPIAGRKQQLIKYKGTTLYPQALFNLLNGMEGIQDYVISLTKNDLGQDELVLHLALAESSSLTDGMIRQALQSALRVVPEIRYPGIAEIRSMQVIEGKRKIHKFIEIG